MLDRMKWQNPGITYFGGGGGGNSDGSKAMGALLAGGGTPVYTSNLEPLAGQSFNSQEELDAAEATQNAVSTAQSTTESIAADPTTAANTGQQTITNLEAQIAQLTPQLADNPALQTQIDSLKEQINSERINLTQAQQLAGQQQAQDQQGLVQAAVTDPASLLEQAQVETTQVTPDQLIAAGTGDAGAAPQATVSTVQDTATMTTPARQAAAEYDASTVSDEVSAVTGDLQAAVAEPSAKATVRGQLESLMSDFEGGETPPWASGPMRQAMGVMQSRGMGASSIAGAAVVQAAMESAISIASQDATTNAQFEMANLNNEQQTSIFKTQQRLAGLFSDQASENAAFQFNATSENQTNQFFSNLEASASQFNASQINATRQFNAGQENAIEQFNTQQIAQREQFNTQNSLIISQANAQWRQSIATAETAAQNVANLEYTRNTNAITGAALDQLWQRERDLMDYAFQSSESAAERANAIILQKLSTEETKAAIKMQTDAASDQAYGSFLAELTTQLLDF